MGMLDAAALAHAVKTSPDIESALAAYAALRKNHVRLYQAMSAVFTPMYQSSSRILPFLRDLGGPVMSWPPMQSLAARLVAGRVLDPLPALGLQDLVPEVEEFLSPAKRERVESASALRGEGTHARDN
jgi:hypothetical protein